jgi:hypothetical protein
MVDRPCNVGGLDRIGFLRGVPNPNVLAGLGKLFRSTQLLK